ncbi:formate dehydrogenase subunit alpha [Ferrimicrobium acidiphilum]|uniref:formate dehydrogenase subunit alpha n=1 Tax=Ferrimicrobium acidiphilum TaxID=121039 RepID=UPI0023F41505|nr:formate dehydrogenase subunit alpha [Ferrimicrobium acidiphilum]
MQEVVDVTIAGVKHQVQPNELLIDVLNRVNANIPQVCYHPMLGTIGTCDLCLVEVDGATRRACEFTVAGGEEVTLTAVASEREGSAQRLLVNHDLYCTICDNNNSDCVLHNTVRDMGINDQPVPYRPKPYDIDDSHPFYRYDPSQCILCGRCVQACQEVQVNETLSIDWSLPIPRVVFDGGVPAGESSCVSCGHCVTVCPCNALMEKSMIGKAGLATNIKPKVREPMISLTKALEPAIGLKPIFALSEMEERLRRQLVKKTKTVCTYCGVGCSFDIWTKGRSILKVNPEHGPMNGISTCVKGKFAWDYVNSTDRLAHPLIREGEHFRQATWEEAFRFIADSLQAIIDRDGPDAVGVIASSKCTNEEAFLAQKLARAVIGTHNVDNCSRYCQSPATMGLWRTVGYGGDSGSVKDIEASDLVLIVGSNTAESHPVIATRVKRAHKSRGQKLIVADLRKHEMAQRADIWFAPRPGTDLVWLSAASKYLFDHDYQDAAFLAQHVENVEEFRASLETFTLPYAAEITGVPEAKLVEVFEALAHARSFSVLWAMGVTQHTAGSDTSTAIANLLLVSGNFGKPGCGAYPLRGHNNVQGASDFGAMPTYFPGYEKVGDPEVVAKYEAAWGVTIPTTQGLDNHQMVDAIHAGSLKALLLTGEEMGLVDANSTVVQDAFRKLEFFVVQDIFFSNTARFADVVLPASPSLEKEGTFTSTERRIQRLYRVFDPLAESRPDWMITQGIARAMGASWNYSHPSEIMAEAAGLAEIFAGVSYERLEGYRSLQWPVAEDGSDSPVLYLDRFHFPSGKARFHPVSFHSPTDELDEEYDIHVNNGRLLEHFHEGNMTYRVAGIAHMTPEPFVEVSPELAKERGVVDGSLVRLTSRRGSVKVRAVITDRVHGKQVYLPMNAQQNEMAVNFLTSSEVDSATHTPAYKELAAKLEVLDATPRRALPRHNFRYGQRTPQRGVNIVAKRSRSDYRDPVAAEISTRPTGVPTQVDDERK